MIAKKNSGSDLEQKRIVFFQLGLFVMGSFTLAAFTYKTPTAKLMENHHAKVSHVQYDIEVEKEEEKVELPQVQNQSPTQPSAPSVSASTLPGEIIQVSTVPTLPVSGVQVGTGTLLLGSTTIFGNDIIDSDIEIIDIPSVDAEYIGGYEAMKKYIAEHINIPQDPYSGPVSGKVFLSFVVEKDGAVSNVKVEQGIAPDIDREAMRVIRSFPNWKPGENKGKIVRTKVRIPITIVTE